MRYDKELIILVGNIGTGKSTLAKEYVRKGYVAIARDDIRYMMGSGGYIWDINLEDAVWKSETDMLQRFMETSVNLLIDEVGINKNMRLRYILYAKKYGYKVIVIRLPLLSMKEAVRRRMVNPHCQPNRKLWEGVWKKFNRMYEEPSKEEGIDKIINLR